MGAPHPVLYAEDEEDDVFFLNRAFCEAGIANPLVVVTDGDAAIEYLSGTGRYSNRAEYPVPCLVLLDLNLPARSGLDVLKWIRAQPAMCALPVLVLTSSTQDADIQRAYAHGANAYLVKPGRPAELRGVINAVKEFWLMHNRTVRECSNYAIKSEGSPKGAD